MTAGLPDPVTGKVKTLPMRRDYADRWGDQADQPSILLVGPDGDPIDKCGNTKFYELEMKEACSGCTRLRSDQVLGVRGQVPGPLFRAKYGEPGIVRYHNHLPSVKIPQAFGIAEITTHLHNGHTPSESDGNPVNYFNSVNDPNVVNPLGYKDQHYPNVGRLLRARRHGRQPDRGPGLAVVPRPPPRFHRTERLQGHVRLLQPVRRARHRRRGKGLKLPCKDYDIPIFFHDALFDSTCQTVFDLFNLDGILGDRFLANGAIQPYLNVAEAALPVPDLRAGPVALVGVVAVGRHQLPAILADLHRRQPAAQRRPGDQRAHGGGRAGRHHRRLRQDQGEPASTSSTVRSRSTAAVRPARPSAPARRCCRST